MESKESGHYRAYPMRWFQLFIFVLSTFSNAISSITFAPIETETSKFFAITTSQVNSLAIVFLFLYPLGTILSIYLSRKYEMRTIIVTGSLINFGTFIRLFSLINPTRAYASLIIGQIFPALAAPFFLNSTALFAARWFSPSQRDIATSICSMANPLGLAVGSLIPSLIISPNPTSKEFLTLLSIEAVFVLLTTLLIIIFYVSEPLTPPSPSEEHHQSINFKKDLTNLLLNRQYLILLFGFSLGLALFNSITTLLEQIIQPAGYTSEDAGIFGAVIIIAGLLNAFVVGFVMDKTHAYRLILKILLLGACSSGFFFILILRPNQFYPLAISIGLMGFFLLPLLPVSFECALESTYPIRAEWSTGLLMCTGNILGGLFIYVLAYLIKLAPQYKSDHIFTPAAIFMVTFFVISSSALFIYKGAYRRLEAERETVEHTSTNS